MARLARNRFQSISFIAIGIITLAGVLWVIDPSFGSPKDSVPDGSRAAIDQMVAISKMTDVIARASDVEVTESVVAGALAVPSNGSEPFDRNRVVKEAVDAEILRGLKLQIAEREGLAGPLNEAVRTLEQSRALCEVDEGCQAFIEGMVKGGLADSHNDYWEQSVAGYQDNLSISNVNNFLAGGPPDFRLPTAIATWQADVSAAEQRLLSGIEIEWLDAEYESAYKAAAR